MQVNSTAHGVGTAIPRRGRRREVMAIAYTVVIVAVMALVLWVGPFGTSGAESANPSAGSAVIHDDPGNVHRTLMPQGARD
jgi:hypothetical protein